MGAFFFCPFWVAFGPFWSVLTAFHAFFVSFCFFRCIKLFSAKMSKSEGKTAKMSRTSAEKKNDHGFSEVVKNAFLWLHSSGFAFKKTAELTFQPTNVCRKWVFVKLSCVNFECLAAL